MADVRNHGWLRLALGALPAVSLLLDARAGGGEPMVCPEAMALVDERFCVDRFEASLELVDSAGTSLGAHPPNRPVDKNAVRAVSRRGVVPQAYISQKQASSACANAGKRLCTNDEWLKACRGTPATRYPYGEVRQRGACNDEGREPLAAVSTGRASPDTWGIDPMNDPRLHLVAGAVARTGRFDRCRTELAVHDMVGNLHEWTDDDRGTMRGGFYLDTKSLGEGCAYAATAHDRDYHDYSTGFRCCKDAALR